MTSSIAEAVDLDLNSTTQTLAGSDIVGSSGQVTIHDEHGTPTTVTGTSSLTPAQYLAALQANSGGQSIVFSANGNATGGTFVANQINGLTSLTVPTGVTAIHDFGTAGSLNLAGNLVNSGSFFAVSSNNRVNTANIGASNIINQGGGLLTSVLPSGGLSGFSNLISQLNLSLSAVNDIINHGTISSSGALNLSAGGSIVNTNVTGSTAVMQAMNALNLTAATVTNQGQLTSLLNNVNVITNNLTNSGLLQSMGGSLSISTLVGNVLSINNVNGLISARDELGIDVGNASSANVLSIVGGALEGSTIRLDSHQGLLSVDVENTSASVDVSARVVDFAVSNGTSGLNLDGLQQVNSGSLSYYGAGDVSFDRFSTGGGSIDITSTSGSITVRGPGNSSQAGDITTSSLTGDAGNVSLIAATTIVARDISTIGIGDGDGGSVILEAGQGITVGNVTSSGGTGSSGITASPGDISIVSGTTGAGDINTGSITAVGAGGAVVTLDTPGAVTVTGDITMPGGTLTLGGSTTNITGAVDVSQGQVTINPQGNGPYVVDLPQLSQLFNGDTLQVGSASSTIDIVLNSDCNQCIGANISNLVFSTSGQFIATGTTLTLADGVGLNVAANNGIFTGNVVGGSSIQFTSNGIVTVDGQLNTNAGGAVILRGAGFDIQQGINSNGGTVQLAATSNTVIDVSQLTSIATSRLVLGDGVSPASLDLVGNAHLGGVGNNLDILLNGNFNSSGANLTVGNNVAVSVSAADIVAGAMSGAQSIAMNAQGRLDVVGDLHSIGGITLAADRSNNGQLLNLQTGRRIEGTTIDVSTGLGDIVSGAILNATAGNLAMRSGGALNLLDSSALSSVNNVAVSALSDIVIGSNGGNGVSINAGAMNGTATGVLDAGSVASSGNIIIDNYMGGAGVGRGSITIGDNVVLTARGGSTAVVDGLTVVQTGNLGVLSGGDINVGQGSTLASYGGDVWLSANNSISLGNGVQLTSVAKLDDSGAVGANGVPLYSGGRVGIMAGLPDADMNALLNSLMTARDGNEQVIVTGGNPLDASNTINMTGGSLLQVVFPTDASKSITNSTFNLAGGVLFLDPPGSGNDVNLNGVQVNVVGVNIAPPPSGGGGGGGGGTGGGIGGSFTNSITGALSTAALTQTLSVTGTVSTIQAGRPLVPTDTQDKELREAPGGVRPAVFCTTPGLLKSSETVDEGSWIMAANKCQPFSFEGADGSIIIGTGPAIFAPSLGRTLLLKEGKLLIVAGSSLVVVRNPLCSVTIPINSACTVEYQPNGVSRVTTLAGGKSSISVTRDDETMIFSAAPGEQLVLANDEVDEQELICLPTVTNQKLDSWMVKLAGMHGQKYKFDRTEMVAREELLNCTLGCFSKAQQDLLIQIRQSMFQNSPKELKTSAPYKNKLSSTNKSPYSPVGFGQVLDLTVPQINTLTGASAVVKYTADARIKLDTPNTIQLQNGDAIVSTSKATTIKAGAYELKLAPGTVAMVSYNDRRLKVRNVYEAKATAIMVSVPNKRLVGLQVGHEAIFTREGTSLMQALGEDPIGRRKVVHSDMAGGHRLVNCEVSIMSLLQNTDAMSQLVRSQAPDDKALINKILKMAGALSIVTRNHGNFSIITTR